MPSEDYAPATSGALKLKGVHPDSKISKHRKKKKKTEQPTPQPDSSIAAAAAQHTANEDSPTAAHDTSKATTAGNDQQEQPAKDDSKGKIKNLQKYTPPSLASAAATTPREGKTEAELRHEEQRRRRLEERLRREGIKTHKERVEELNRYLSNLSEHHDILPGTYSNQGSARMAFELEQRTVHRDVAMGVTGAVAKCGSGSEVPSIQITVTRAGLKITNFYSQNGVLSHLRFAYRFLKTWNASPKRFSSVSRGLNNSARSKRATSRLRQAIAAGPSNCKLVVTPVLLAEIFDPGRQLVLPSQILLELEGLREPMPCQTLFQLFNRATVLGQRIVEVRRRVALVRLKGIAGVSSRSQTNQLPQSPITAVVAWHLELQCRHCCITFEAERRLIVRDCYSKGSTVTYNKKDAKRRRNFTWIIRSHGFPDGINNIVIEIHEKLKSQIVVSEPSFLDLFFDNVDQFLAEVAENDELHPNLPERGYQGSIALVGNPEFYRQTEQINTRYHLDKGTVRKGHESARGAIEKRFVKGATAYRNARDWTKEQRDQAIKRANERVNDSQVGTLAIDASFGGASSFTTDA
ncbi:MAG: hypothetical protein Q9163_001119 [Psora crenata]